MPLQKCRGISVKYGVERANNKWTYNKYDKYDRQVYTGTVSGGTYDSHKSALTSQTIHFESFQSATGSNLIFGYTKNTYPTSVIQSDVMNVSYYDNYAWKGPLP